MPIYEYKCQSCGQVSEFLVHGGSESEDHKCPDCGSRSLERVLSVPSLLKTSSNSPGTTCCGRTERCDKPPCSSGEGCRRN